MTPTKPKRPRTVRAWAYAYRHKNGHVHWYIMTRRTRADARLTREDYIRYYYVCGPVVPVAVPRPGKRGKS